MPGTSTGPKTAKGKERSSQNARKHGCTSRKLILPGERQEEYDALLWDWLEDFQPQAATAVELVEQTAQAHWLYLRVQKQCDLAEAGLKNQNPREWTEAEWKLRERMGRYRTSAERAFHRALNVIEARRKSRRAESDGAERLQMMAQRIELQHLGRLEQTRIADEKLKLQQAAQERKEAERAAKNKPVSIAKKSEKLVFGVAEQCEAALPSDQAGPAEVDNLPRSKERGRENRR